MKQRSYFFDEGICFQCQQCGDCCVGEPGTIYVTPTEIRSIAAYLSLAPPRFIDDYLYPFKDSYSIREDDTGHCAFFDSGCRIYDVRPLQCRSFPFWFSNLRSQRRWRRISNQCPGIGQGPRFGRKAILQIARTTMHF